MNSGVHDQQLAPRLLDRVAIVTGGSGGIGAAIARSFLDEGALVVVADVSPESAASRSEQVDDRFASITTDVCREDDWLQLLERTQRLFGAPTVLVNNAGVLRHGPLIDTTLNEWNEVIGVNQTGVFLGLRTVAPFMIDVGGGTIINISSVDGLAGMPFMGAYVASKFAVRGLTKVAALELAPHGIRVNSIHPGPIDTAMTRVSDSSSAAEAAFKPIIPLGRIGDPAEVARLAVFLASADSSYCTGAEFVIDGGWTASVPLPALA